MARVIPIFKYDVQIGTLQFLTDTEHWTVCNLRGNRVATARDTDFRTLHKLKAWALQELDYDRSFQEAD